MEIITGDGLERLNQLSQSARSIQAAVAYWTLPIESHDPAFLRAISHPDGFLCCDIHAPTSIDCLTELRANMANVYLHLYQLVGKNDVPDSKGMPDNLMHSKVYVFDDGSDKVQLWVGSHNATTRAMLGINFECAVLSTIEKSSLAYSQVMQHLQTIRKTSTLFNLAHVGHYRSLQGGWGADGFIEVIDHLQVPLVKGSEIGIFGSILDDHKQLKKVGKRLYLALNQPATGLETFYKVEITQSGILNNSRSNAGLRFGDRRSALRFASRIPTLDAYQPVTSDIHRRSSFFVTLKIGDPLPSSTVVVEAPPEKVWGDVLESEYFQSIRSEIILPSEKAPAVGRRAIYKLQKPIELVTEHLQDNQEGLRKAKAFQTSSVEEKIALKDHSLIRKRIILRD